MSNEQFNEKQRLLSEVLGGDSFQAFNDDLKQHSLGEFRRARLVRRTAAGSLAGVILCMALLGGLFFRSRDQRATSNPATARPVNAAAASIIPANQNEPAAARTLTDEQLIASFPPNSCFLAEVNGRKMLVFRSAELKKQFLH